MSSSNAGSASLRPGWHKGASGGSGRGFQPPPTVTADRGDKGRSSSWGSQERRDSNKFSALQDDEDGPSSGVRRSDDKPSGNSRSEAFRSSFNRGSSAGNKAGRSLADLAASVPDSGPAGRRSSYDTRGPGSRFLSVRSTDSSGMGGSIDSYKPDPKVIRYTREKLLSLRPPPRGGEEDKPPPDLLLLDGSVIVSNTAQDPVCWDTFDGEEIWEMSRERRMSGISSKGPPGVLRVSESTDEPRTRRNLAAPSSGRWQRGVALPPPEEGGRRKDRDAENPNELWDDPIASGAAADFSAFGAMPEDGDAFDFDKVAEASKKLEEELHGPPSADDDDDEQQHYVKVDPNRPLASAGMTLTSGSGDDVNVFEDFDSPGVENAETEKPTVRSGSEDPNASSRLMKMIGVTREPSDSNGKNKEAADNPWGTTEASSADAIDPIIGSIGGVPSGIGSESSAIPLNPWGNPAGQQASQQQQDGSIDLAARLEVLAAEQKAREVQAAEIEKRAHQEAEILRRRQDEENQRRAMAQRQAHEQARQRHVQAAAMQQQQQPSQQSQVELVLMERICSILENSWGRSDLVSILTTLHSEDSRVIPLLGNVDALRALVTRSPQRVTLRRDPNFAGDMAVLLVTNSQWQQQQQAQARAQQEELQRRRMEEEARTQAQNRAVSQIDPDLPWFYSDPQKNIQGPFRGEEMRQWLEAGYFKGDLPISQQAGGPFHPLSALFPDLAVAFRAVSSQTSQEDGDRQVADEERRKMALEEEAQRVVEAAEAAKAEVEAAKAAELERAKKERLAAEAEDAAAPATAEKSAAANGGNDSSNQLKMMLGLPSESQGVTEETTAEPKLAAPSKKQPSEKRASRGSNKQPQPKVAEEPPVPVEKMLQPAKSAASAAWGGATKAKPKKSMSEIQQEEARAAAMMAAAQKDGMPLQSSSGWANVAATGKAGWSSGTLKQAPAPVPAQNPGSRSVQQRAKPQTVAQADVSPVRNVSPITQQQRSSSTASSSTPAEEFGASMSPSLEKWCKDQMQKINGSDDLTLVAFCMTLNDASEIRQYLTTYLGSTSAVNSFATEFINKRGLGNRQEEWETPGSAKKGRKKKAGGR